MFLKFRFSIRKTVCLILKYLHLPAKVSDSSSNTSTSIKGAVATAACKLFHCLIVLCWINVLVSDGRIRELGWLCLSSIDTSKFWGPFIFMGKGLGGGGGGDFWGASKNFRAKISGGYPEN